MCIFRKLTRFFIVIFLVSLIRNCFIPESFAQENLIQDCLDSYQKTGTCPTDHCQIMISCNGKKICYAQIKSESLKCGGLAYAGQDVSCCEGLVKRCGVEFFEGTCSPYSKNSIPVCLPCGNGICNEFENRCNCPEDCGKPNKI